VRPKKDGEWALDGAPIVEGDLLSVAVAADGQLAVLARRAPRYYHLEVLSPAGDEEQVQAAGEPSCEVAWSGEDLLVSRWSCTKDDPPGDIVRLRGDALNGAAVKVVPDGEDPATAPA
jgi:hypothetical protein